ncbi:MAG: single-stranded DNA-binding protein, partial [Lachnospiraceae bacterium]|nr:single-stranded DNA-binding protein [Lachnospiraceae bacterium]
AVDRRFKREGEPDADFFNCTAFNKQAEFIERYLRKGVKVVVSGRIQNDNYTNRDGQMVYSVRVIVDEIEFAESKNASGNSDGGFGNGGYAGGNNSTPAPSAAGDGFMNIPDGIDEELPFN